MIDNLRLTTERNTEQDWLKTNLARVTGMLQGQRDLATVGSMLLAELAPLVGAHQGLLYQVHAENPCLQLMATYAARHNNGYPDRLVLGEGFIGQCAADRRPIVIAEVIQSYGAEDEYKAQTPAIDPLFTAAATAGLASWRPCNSFVPSPGTY